MFQVGGILSAVPKAFFIFVSRPIRKTLFRPHRVILAAVPYAATGRKKKLLHLLVISEFM